jgi:putative solute:sodium symporter small subunit
MDEHQAIESRYWRRVLRITGGLLFAWLMVTLVGPWFARDLGGLSLFGFPLSFWVASQGALLLYLAIIVVYVLLMERLDREFHQPSNGEPQDGHD